MDSVKELEKMLDSSKNGRSSVEETDVSLPGNLTRKDLLQDLRNQEVISFNRFREIGEINRKIKNDQAADNNFSQAETCLKFIKEIDATLQVL